MIRGTLLAGALFATTYATIAFALGMDQEFYTAAWVGIFALIACLITERLTWRRERDARIRAEREQVWQRRDRESGLR